MSSADDTMAADDASANAADSSGARTSTKPRKARRRPPGGADRKDQALPGRRTSTERRQASDERQRAEGRVRVAGWVSAEALALLDRLVAVLGSRDVALDTVLHHVDLEIRNGMRAIGRPVWVDGKPVCSGEHELLALNVPAATMVTLERAGADAGYRSRTEAVLAVLDLGVRLLEAGHRLRPAWR